MKHLPLALGALTCALVVACPARAREAVYAVAVAGGMHVPYDSDHERVYGTPAAGSLILSGQISDADSWVDIGVGARHASGPEFVGPPGFDIDDAAYVIVPISLGLRRNLAPRSGAADAKVRAYASAGFVFAVTRVSLPDGIEGGGESETDVQPGFYLELRPEARVTGAWNAFARARLEMMSSAEFELVNSLNPGGGRLQVGVSRWLR